MLDVRLQMGKGGNIFQEQLVHLILSHIIITLFPRRILIEIHRNYMTIVSDLLILTNRELGDEATKQLIFFSQRIFVITSSMSTEQ